MNFKIDRKEELIAGLAAKTLNDQENNELAELLLGSENSDNQIVEYEQLIKEMQSLPDLNPPITLQKKVYSFADSSNNIPITRIILLLLFSVIGLFAFSPTGQNLRYAKTTDENIDKKLISAGFENRTFKLKPAFVSEQGKGIMKASLVIRDDKPTNILQVNGLPKLDSGLTYRLWAFTSQGPQGCVSFSPDELGNVYMKVPSQPTKSALDVSITIDKVIPGRGPDIPGTTILTSI